MVAGGDKTLVVDFVFWAGLFMYVPGLLLVFSALYYFHSLQGGHSEPFLHLVLCILFLGIFWLCFATGLVLSLLPLNDPPFLYHFLVVAASPFVLEFLLFYLSFFSNRSRFVERYALVLLGVVFGTSLVGLIQPLTVLLSTYLSAGFLLLVVVVLLYQTFFLISLLAKKIKEVENSPAAYQFLSLLRKSVLLIMVVASLDAVWFVSYFVIPSLQTPLLVVGVLFLTTLTILFMSLVNKMSLVIPKLDMANILNELS